MGAHTSGFQWFNEYKLQNDHYYSLISVFSLADRDASLVAADKEYPYWPTNHVESACREAGANATDIEGGYGGDCIHFCNYEDADEVYDPNNEDDNTNAYCIEGYDYSEKYMFEYVLDASWDAESLDVCQTICVPTGESLKYVSQKPAHYMYMLRDAWSETHYDSDYA